MNLLQFHGVGRKSANVIMLEAFNKPVGIAVDTHAKRISNKMGFSSESEPSKIEQDLFVFHGRNYCDSRKPKCSECPVNRYCDFYKKL